MHFKMADALFCHVNLLLAIRPKRNVGWRRTGELDTFKHLPTLAKHGHVTLPNNCGVEVAVCPERHAIATSEAVWLGRI